MIVLYVFLGLIAIRLLAIGLILVLALSVGPGCPACGGDTVLLQTRGLDRWARWLERRWCLDCGWQGLVRRGPSRRGVSPVVEPRRSHRRLTR